MYIEIHKSICVFQESDRSSIENLIDKLVEIVQTKVHYVFIPKPTCISLRDVFSDNEVRKGQISYLESQTSLEPIKDKYLTHKLLVQNTNRADIVVKEHQTVVYKISVRSFLRYKITSKSRIITESSMYDSHVYHVFAQMYIREYKIGNAYMSFERTHGGGKPTISNVYKNSVNEMYFTCAIQESDCKYPGDTYNNFKVDLPEPYICDYICLNTFHEIENLLPLIAITQLSEFDLNKDTVAFLEAIDNSDDISPRLFFDFKKGLDVDKHFREKLDGRHYWTEVLNRSEFKINNQSKYSIKASKGRVKYKKIQGFNDALLRQIVTNHTFKSEHATSRGCLHDIQMYFGKLVFSWSLAKA